MNLTLEKATEICTAEDSTRRQIESLRPDLAKRILDTPALDQKEVHKFNTRHSPPKRNIFKCKYPDLLNPHNLTTLSASSVGAHRHTKIDKNVQQSTKVLQLQNHRTL